jgi:pyruvate dehydrogenase E2 component (dihydrolipoamide acetyltransferase)
MPINILMPALSPTMEKGNLSKWLKQEGDKVRSGDVIAEIETDKATMEVEASDDGTLAKILVAAGTADVPVNQVIALLASEGEDVGQAGKQAVVAPPATQAPPMTKTEPPAGSGASSAAKPAPVPPAGAAPSPQPGHASQPGHVPLATPERIFSSPLARRLAREIGIDLVRVQGSGPHGRVIARDVEGAKSGAPLKPETVAAPAAVAAPPPAGPGEQQIRALFAEGSYDFIPHDSMRKIIAQRLTLSKQTIPHFYLTLDCELTQLMAAREAINAAAPKNADGKPAYKISVNDFVIKAMAMALQRVPMANVTWTDTGLLRHKASDVGVAVAIPGGLITPVVRGAESKPLSAISNEMKDFAVRARARKLAPHEYQGGATAISNLGMYGIKEFAAVINPPQATILAVGVGEERAVVRGGKIDAVAMMTVTLSTDHRAVDGALGAELLGAFKALIENPVMMIA